MTGDIDNGQAHTLEVSPELTVKELLSRVAAAGGLDLTERGVVLAHVERVGEEVNPFDRDQVRTTIEEIDELRSRVGTGLTMAEVLDSISEGRA